MQLDANPICEEFKLLELTEIMRQKDKTKFIEALNNLPINKLTEDYMYLFKSRIITDESKIPKSAIRLLPENINVDCFNQNKISNHPGIEYQSKARDVVLGKITENSKKTFQDTFINKETF